MFTNYLSYLRPFFQNHFYISFKKALSCNPSYLETLQFLLICSYSAQDFSAGPIQHYYKTFLCCLVKSLFPLCIHKQFLLLDDQGFHQRGNSQEVKDCFQILNVFPMLLILQVSNLNFWEVMSSKLWHSNFSRLYFF